jgi:hypothetical protein
MKYLVASILDGDFLPKATLEYGIRVVEDLMNLVALKDPDTLITFKEVHDLVRQEYVMRQNNRL